MTEAFGSFIFFLPLSLSDMQVVYFPNCQHSCCQDCAGKHFTIIIKDRGISEATCPFCMEPKGLADDDDLAADYFANLDVIIKPIVDQDVYDLFQRKIRDRTLMKDPNFKWCYKVSFRLPTQSS